MLKAESMKEKKIKLNFVENKNFCSVKNIVKRIKRKATYWEKMLTKRTSDRALPFKIYKESLNSVIRK